MCKETSKNIEVVKMIKINKILIPTDFSRCAEQAFTHAIYFVEKYQSELHILNVNTLFEEYPEFTSNISAANDIRKMAEDSINEQINKMVDNVTLKNFEIIKCQKRGISAATTILEYSHDNDIDLIVMGTHGRRGLGHLFLGSVAEEVVRFSACPVYTIREEDEPKPIEQFTNILVPIDFSDCSSTSLKYAKEIAKLYRSKLQLLHVIEDTIPPAYSLVGINNLFPDLEDKTSKRLENLFNETDGPKVQHDNYIVNGHAAKEILNFAKTHNTNLIVIATHGLTGIEHFLMGSVAEKVVRMAPCPVFTTKSFGKSIIFSLYKENKK